MITYQRAVKQLKTIVEAGDAGILDRVFLMERLSKVSKTGVYFLYYFLDFGEERPPITNNPDAHITQSFAKMADLMDKFESGGIQIFTYKELKESFTSQGDLSDNAKLERLLVTVYSIIEHKQISLALEIIEIFEKITDGYVNFKSTPIHDGLVCKKIYTVLCGYYFSNIPDRTKDFLLQNSFIVHLLRLDFDVEKYIKDYIQSYVTLHIRRRLSLNFASDLAINKAPIGTLASEEETTVEDWIGLGRGLIANVQDRHEIEGIVSTHPDVMYNPEYEQDVIKRLILLYFDLVSGSFILEEETKELLGKTVFGTETQMLSDMYKSKFKDEVKNHISDFADWISENRTKDRMMLWLDQYPTAKEKREALVDIFKRNNIDLENDANLTALLEFGNFLEESGLGDDGDLVLFNEGLGSFEWNN